MGKLDRLICSECEVVKFSEDELESHICKEHVGCWLPYQCYYCLPNTNTYKATSAELKEHQIQRHPGEIFKKIETENEENRKRVNEVLSASISLSLKPEPDTDSTMASKKKKEENVNSANKDGQNCTYCIDKLGLGELFVSEEKKREHVQIHFGSGRQTQFERFYKSCFPSLTPETQTPSAPVASPAPKRVPKRSASPAKSPTKRFRLETMTHTDVQQACKATEQELIELSSNDCIETNPGQATPSKCVYCTSCKLVLASSCPSHIDLHLISKHCEADTFTWRCSACSYGTQWQKKQVLDHIKNNHKDDSNAQPIDIRYKHKEKLQLLKQQFIVKYATAQGEKKWRTECPVASTVTPKTFVVRTTNNPMRIDQQAAFHCTKCNKPVRRWHVAPHVFGPQHLKQELVSCSGLNCSFKSYDVAAVKTHLKLTSGTDGHQDAQIVDIRGMMEKEFEQERDKYIEAVRGDPLPSIDLYKPTQQWRDQEVGDSNRNGSANTQTQELNSQQKPKASETGNQELQNDVAEETTSVCASTSSRHFDGSDYFDWTPYLRRSERVPVAKRTPDCTYDDNPISERRKSSKDTLATFKCQPCNKLLRVQYVDTHLFGMEHLNKKLLSCSKCGLPSFSIVAVQRHIKTCDHPNAQIIDERYKLSREYEELGEECIESLKGQPLPSLPLPKSLPIEIDPPPAATSTPKQVGKVSSEDEQKSKEPGTITTTESNLMVTPVRKESNKAGDSVRIYLANFPENTVSDQVKELLSKYGTVVKHLYITDDLCAFVTMQKRADAQRAAEDLDGCLFDSNRLEVKILN